MRCQVSRGTVSLRLSTAAFRQPGFVLFGLLIACLQFVRCSSTVPTAGIREYPVQISNLGAGVNSPEDDFAPSITANGKRLVFTSGRKDLEGNAQRDFWITFLDGDFWTRPQNMGALINTPQNEGTPSITADGQILYLAACDRSDTKGKCDIYRSALEGKAWTKVENLGFPVNSSEWESQPSVSADGRTLFFISNRQGGIGGLDIWKSEQDQFGLWKLPENLGPGINTPGNEVSPCIAADGKTLYFASDGHGGLGGTDMFVSRIIGTSWSEPINVGTPLNSSGDDEFFTLSAEGSVVFFASVRSGGLGGLDLYRAEPNPFPPGSVVVVSGIVADKKTRKPLESVLTVKDKKNGVVIGTHKSNTYSGEYVIVVPVGAEYEIIASSNGYPDEAAVFDLLRQSTYADIHHDFLLKKDEKEPGLSAIVSTDVLSSDFSLLKTAGRKPGLTIEEQVTAETIPLLNYVFFKENSFSIPDRYTQLTNEGAGNYSITSLPGETIQQYHQILNIIGLRMKQNPSAELVLTGTTDTRESSGDTDLSRKRAEEVKKYFTGIWSVDPLRIKVVARMLPEAPSKNSTPEGQEENRRVEISSNNPAILDPIETREVQRIFKPATAVFHLSIQADAGLSEWKFAIHNKEELVKVSDGYSAYPDSIVWDWRNAQGAVPTEDGAFQFVLSAKDNNGLQTQTAPQSIPVNFVSRERKALERLPDRTLEKISLILFDFDKADVGERNRRMLSTASKRIGEGTGIIIRGYTDALGDEMYNQKLSEKRAAAVKTQLMQFVSNAAVRSEGKGESQLLFPNDLPEGRFYCRTVQILVETIY